MRFIYLEHPQPQNKDHAKSGTVGWHHPYFSLSRHAAVVPSGNPALMVHGKEGEDFEEGKDVG